jgi:nucleoside permease NupC
MRGLVGIFVLLLLSWLISEDRFRVPVRVVAAGVLLQLALALLLAKFQPAALIFLWLDHGVEVLQQASEAGTGFVFGYLGGGPLPFAETHAGASYILAFRALPLVLVLSALASLLFYWGVLQRIVPDSLLALLPSWGGAPLTLQRLFAYGFRPVIWLIGIPADETAAAAALMGTKTVLNEFIAYVDLSRLPEAALSPRSRLIMTYAMCGFANFGRLGILIGGMGAMVPERRHEIVALGLRSILSGTIATAMSGAVIGLL